MPQFCSGWNSCLRVHVPGVCWHLGGVHSDMGVIWVRWNPSIGARTTCNLDCPPKNVSCRLQGLKFQLSQVTLLSAACVILSTRQSNLKFAWPALERLAMLQRPTFWIHSGMDYPNHAGGSILYVCQRSLRMWVSVLMIFSNQCGLFYRLCIWTLLPRTLHFKQSSVQIFYSLAGVVFLTVSDGMNGLKSAQFFLCHEIEPRMPFCCQMTTTQCRVTWITFLQSVRRRFRSKRNQVIRKTSIHRGFSYIWIKRRNDTWLR